MDPNIDKPPSYYPNDPPPGYQSSDMHPYPAPGYQSSDMNSYPSPGYPGNDINPYPPFRPIMPFFGKDPLQTTCVNCGQIVVTKVAPLTGVCAGIAAVIVFLVCFPFFWVPLVIDSCKDVQHICPCCNAVLGVYKRL